MPAAHAAQRSRIIYRRGIGRICGALPGDSTRTALLPYRRGACRTGYLRACFSRPARPLCPRSWYRSAEDDGVDGAYHLLLHDLVLFDGYVTDAGHVLHVDILKRALELLVLHDRRAGAVGDVEVYIAPDTSRKAGTKDRIQADCQLNGSTKLIQFSNHVG